MLLDKLKLINKEEWSIVSSQKSNTKWTVKDNLTFLHKKIDHRKTKCGFPKLLITVNKYLTKPIGYNQLHKITNVLCEYIHKISNISVNYLQETLNAFIKNDADINLIQIKHVEYQLKSSWLY